MSKYKVGDYIRYTPKNAQQVIDRLLAEGEDIYNKRDWMFWSVVCKDYKNQWCCCIEFYDKAKNDITESFLTPYQPLPEKWYIDCGDKIEVREWLEELGYVKAPCYDYYKMAGRTTLQSFLNTKQYTVRSQSLEDLKDKGYTKIIPTISTRPVTTQVEHVSGWCIENTPTEPLINKELEALETSYKELGEKIKALKGS